MTIAKRGRPTADIMLLRATALTFGFSSGLFLAAWILEKLSPEGK